MLGHVRVMAVDPNLPASLSPKIITDIIRKEWKFDGVLITDDFNMGAISQRKEGIGKSAVRAVNAGADLVLLSYDGSQYYHAMYEMIRAYYKGELDQTALNHSNQRLLAFAPLLQ
jgi:beta-N-acetylhexosaminidase